MQEADWCSLKTWYENSVVCTAACTELCVHRVPKVSLMAIDVVSRVLEIMTEQRMVPKDVVHTSTCMYIFPKHAICLVTTLLLFWWRQHLSPECFDHFLHTGSCGSSHTFSKLLPYLPNSFKSDFFKLQNNNISSLLWVLQWLPVLLQINPRLNPKAQQNCSWCLPIYVCSLTYYLSWLAKLEPPPRTQSQCSGSVMLPLTTALGLPSDPWDGRLTLATNSLILHLQACVFSCAVWALWLVNPGVIKSCLLRTC